MASPWNPGQYEKFRNERSQPFFDLLSLVEPLPGGRAVDLGCGTGELTRVLHERSGSATTLGIDSSETMLVQSAAFAGNGLSFEQADIGTFSPETPFDLVFSNAALQWLDDHEQVIPAVAALVAPGGQLAVQVPSNHDHPSHVVGHEVALEFSRELRGYDRAWPVLSPERYAELLDGLGFDEISVRLQVYVHHLPGREDVVEWTKGTFLTDYQRRLSAEDFERFLARYRDLLLPELQDTHPHFYPFKRILIRARRPA